MECKDPGRYIPIIYLLYSWGSLFGVPSRVPLILRLYWDNGKENGNYYSIIRYIVGIYWDSGKENGNYYSIIRYIVGIYWNSGKENGNYFSA